MDKVSDDGSLLLGLGNGNFRGPFSFDAGTAPSALIVGDFNGDGKRDLAVACAGSNQVRVLWGNGNGTFKEPLDLEVGSAPSALAALAAADFNGDGKPALAVANRDSNDVRVLLNC